MCLEHLRYAKAVDSYATLSSTRSIYGGGHLQKFATYLLSPYKPRANDVLNSRQVCFDASASAEFATLYDFSRSGAERRFQLRTLADLEAVKPDLATAETQSQVLFIRGYPSAEWINAIGASLDIDPEFFFSHLELYSSARVHSAWSSPLLPSVSICYPRLRITTLAQVAQPAKNATDNQDVHSLRDRNHSFMRRHLDRIRRNKDVKVGDSLLRNCTVHSASSFSLEQDISVAVKRTEKGWIGKKIFLFVASIVRLTVVCSRRTNGSW